MSRLEAALRRAGKLSSKRETFNVPSARALDWFAVREGSGSGDAPRRDAAAAELNATVAPSAAMQPAHPTASTITEALPEPLPQPVDVERPVGSPATHEKLVVNGNLPHSAAEQYRRVAGLLHHGQRDRGIHVVMIASAVAGEGKTLTAVNLALTLSESYQRRVLLIDADLRRPMVHEVLGVSNSAFGLSALLRAPDDRPLRTFHVTRRLELAPSGAPDPDPVSGLTSERMQRVIADAATRYDWVIIDTPPVALLPDANLLAAMVDVAILVIRAGCTPLALVQKAVDTVGRDRLAGVVLNRIEQPAGSAYYGYGYGYGPYGATKSAQG